VKHIIRKTAVLFAALSLSLVPIAARAHCDTLDGPVVKTALVALDKGDVRPVLAWVKEGHDREIQSAFAKALEARKRQPASHEASDHRFLETLVRVHRAGEGAPYTGLKAAGEGVGAAVQAADHAIEKGSVAGVEHALAEEIRSGLHDRFATLSARQPPGADVAAGRAWVEAYVDYVHYVERLELLARTTTGHGDHHSTTHAAGAGAKSDGGSAGSKAHAH
jgi:hypothetical protein